MRCCIYIGEGGGKRERESRLFEKNLVLSYCENHNFKLIFYCSKWLPIIFQYCYRTCSFNWKCGIPTSGFGIIIPQNVVISTCPTQIGSFKSCKRGTLFFFYHSVLLLLVCIILVWMHEIILKLLVYFLIVCLHILDSVYVMWNTTILVYKSLVNPSVFT